MRDIMADFLWDSQYRDMELLEIMRDDDSFTLDDVAKQLDIIKAEIEAARKHRPELYNNLESVLEKSNNGR